MGLRVSKAWLAARAGGPKKDKKVNSVPPIPTESQEQRKLIAWKNDWKERFPELELLHSNANGGYRAKRTAVIMHLEGTVRGIPDLFLPIPKYGYHGLYIELKRTRGGRLSEEQKHIIALLKDQHYKVEVCKGFEEARKVIVDYLKLDPVVMRW
jgi:hypothetical protein